MTMLDLARNVPKVAAVAQALSGQPYMAYGKYPAVVVRPAHFGKDDGPKFTIALSSVPGEQRITDDQGTDVTALFLERLSQ